MHANVIPQKPNRTTSHAMRSTLPMNLSALLFSARFVMIFPNRMPTDASVVAVVLGNYANCSVYYLIN